MGYVAAGAVPGVVNIAGPVFGFRVVCGDCCERVIIFFLWQGWTGGRISFEGRSSLQCLITGCLVVTTRAQRLRRGVPLLEIT